MHITELNLNVGKLLNTREDVENLQVHVAESSTAFGISPRPLVQ